MGINCITFFLALALAVIHTSKGLPDNTTSQNRPPRNYFDHWYYYPYSLNAYALPYYTDPYFQVEGLNNIDSQYQAVFRDGQDDKEGRLNGLGASALSNLLLNNRFGGSSNRRFRPFASLANLLPITWNPNAPRLFSSFDSCTSPAGESGVCTLGSACSALGGRPSGSCALAGVCCVNAVSQCGATISMNNTYWSSPTTGTIPSACSVNIKLDQQLLEQTKAICQVRLDFVSFTTAQPEATNLATASSCTTDSFEVIGATNSIPTICGENSGQHMYLHVPNSDTDPSFVQLVFKFGSSPSISRSWKIRVSMLPCGASYLAPQDCLQYITSSLGSVKSFNYADSNSVLRQLANQDYNICFRTEQMDGKKASSICLSKCSGTTSFFRLSSSGPTSTDRHRARVDGACRLDYLTFNGGAVGDFIADRYCGENFHSSDGERNPATVCSTMKPFRLYYHTDLGEINIETSAPRANIGFCFDFAQKFA